MRLAMGAAVSSRAKGSKDGDRGRDHKSNDEEVRDDNVLVGGTSQENASCLLLFVNYHKAGGNARTKGWGGKAEACYLCAVC